MQMSQIMPRNKSHICAAFNLNLYSISTLYENHKCSYLLEKGLAISLKIAINIRIGRNVNKNKNVSKQMKNPKINS